MRPYHCAIQYRHCPGFGAEGDAILAQMFDHAGQEIGGDFVVDEQCIERVADGGALCLGVVDDGKRVVQVGGLVHI